MLLVLSVALVATMLGRLVQVQVVDAAQYDARAVSANTRVSTAPATRGRILAADRTPLVTMTTAPAITVDPATLARSGDQGRALLARVARVIDRPVAQLLERTKVCGTPGAPRAPTCFDGAAHDPIPIAEGVPAGRALTLLERPEDFPGLAVRTEQGRAYPALGRVNLAHLLGHLGRTSAADLQRRPQLTAQDLVGRSGLEQQYDAQLRGTPGRSVVAVDARGLPQRQVSATAPVPGRDLVTSLLPDVQRQAERTLAATMSRARADGNPAESGAVVVLDASDGAVVALASAPTFDPRVWSGGVSATDYARLTDARAGSPLVNRATSWATAPASTFKAFSLPAAIASGADPKGTFDCSSSVRIGDRSFRNYESVAYGPITMQRALEVSCDTVFYRWAYAAWQKAGGTRAAIEAPDPFADTARSFGLGSPTGIDLPTEAAGRIPDRAWKQRYAAATRAGACARARDGYPGVDPTRAEYLRGLDRENCSSGGAYRAGDAVNFSIGQGDVAVTPLQIAVGYAAIANGGTLWEPRVAAATQRPDGGDRRAVPAQRAGTVGLPAQALTTVREGLSEVTRRGTAREAFAGFDLGTYPVSGKTGTAEVYGKQATSWFASYGPRTASGRQYVVVVAIADAGTGATYAAPAARSIWDVLRRTDAAAGAGRQP